MNLETVVAYTLIAFISIASPGPAIILALRNSLAFGMRAVVWSSLGNVLGLFVLSCATMLGLGALLMSSSVVFSVVKVLGACYLFYLGARHLFGKSSVLMGEDSTSSASLPRPALLFKEAFLLAATNPKPVLFFSALFPQFLNAQVPLLPQFFILTGIFMALSFGTLLVYARLASQARSSLRKPKVAKWINRLVGSVFVFFGAVLLMLRRPAT